MLIGVRNRLRDEIVALRDTLKFDLDLEEQLLVEDQLQRKEDQLLNLEWGIRNFNPRTDIRFLGRTTELPSVAPSKLPLKEQRRRQLILDRFHEEHKEYKEQQMAQRGRGGQILSDFQLKTDVYAARSLDPPIPYSFNRLVSAEIKRGVERQMIQARDDATFIVGQIKDAGIRSKTAAFWIAEAAGSKTYPVSLDQAVQRWLQEVNGPLAEIDRQAKANYSEDPTTQAMFFGIRTMYYLMFGIYTEDQVERLQYQRRSINLQCPYTDYARNFMLTLITTGRCLCLCYTNYLLAAAEEFGYTQIYGHHDFETELEGSGHIFPIIVDSTKRPDGGDRIVISIEAGFQNNNYLLLRFYDHPDSENYLKLENVLQKLYFINIEVMDPEKKVFLENLYLQNSQWYQLISALNHLMLKSWQSADNVIAMSLVAFMEFLPNPTLIDAYRNNVSSYMTIAEEQQYPNIALLNHVFTVPARVKYWDDALKQTETSTDDSILEHERHVIQNAPVYIAGNTVLYKRGPGIKVDFRVDVISFGMMVRMLEYSRSLFLFEDLGNNNNPELRRFQVSRPDDEQKDTVLYPQTFGVRVGINGVSFKELTPEVEEMIVEDVALLASIVTKDEFDTIIAPSMGGNTFGTITNPDVAEFITTTLKDAFTPPQEELVEAE